MPPAARILDLHVCPMWTGLVPHVAGPIIPSCATTVRIGFLPAARVTDKCVCVGPTDVITKGSATVLIEGLAAARMWDTTAHGGVIVTGWPTVIIGDKSSGGAGAGGDMTGGKSFKAASQAAALIGAHASQAAFCEHCPK